MFPPAAEIYARAEGVVIVVQHRMVARFGCDDTAPSEARRWLASVLDSWQLYDRREDVLLSLSELVNNAIRHCHSGVEVAVAQPGRVVHVEVFDDGAGQPPLLKEGIVHGEHGRGLHLVAAIADRWGYREVPPRKAVWFELTV